MEEHLTKDEKKALRQEEWKKKDSTEKRKSLMNKIIMWGVGALILAGSVWFLMTLVNSPASDVTKLTNQTPVSTNDIVFGSVASMSAKPKAATLIEYADFQCPACGLYHPIVKQLMQKYKDKVLFVYRYMPLPQIHRNAMSSAEASYAALKQGKFWGMHDMLFETQQKWAEVVDPSSIFEGYAKSLALNLDQFKKDMDSQAAKDFINNEENKGTESGVNSTPTFFLNDNELTLPLTLDNFSSLIDHELSKK